MNAAMWLVAVASVGIDVGWQPVDEGGYELFLQIEPEQLENLRAGEPLTSDLPELPERVVRVYWMVGDDPLPQTIRPAATAASNEPEATTSRRPIVPSDPGELSLTDGRTGARIGANESATTTSAAADPASQRPTLQGSSKPATIAETSSGDDWHAAPPDAHEASAPAADLAAQVPSSTGALVRPPTSSFAAPLDRVGPIDPSETDIDLSDGIEVAPAASEFSYEAEPAGNTSPTDEPAAAGADEDVTAASTAASTTGPSVAEHRARPESPPPTAADESVDASAANVADEPPPPAGDAEQAPGDAASGVPRPLAWLAAVIALVVSLAANVFFFWGLVDAKRRYRLALQQIGLRETGLLPT
ncbi:MAG: hypothetical protein AB7O68_06170 [Pirellulales bacterium]